MVSKRIWIIIAVALFLLISSLALNILSKESFSNGYKPNDYSKGNPKASVNLVIIPNQANEVQKNG